MKRNKLNQNPNYSDQEIKVGTSDEWRTPLDLFDKINNEFHFVFDLAASSSNHLCHSFYTQEDSAFDHTWLYNSYANIPYSSPRRWYEKARDSAIFNAATIVLLVKVATSENYWIETVKDAHVRFLAGRIKFWDENNRPHYGATFGNALVIFSPSTIGNHNSSYWDYRLEKPEKLF